MSVIAIIANKPAVRPPSQPSLFAEPAAVVLIAVGEADNIV
jgi:hypothetical protein